jgi:hypothetical protein
MKIAMTIISPSSKKGERFSVVLAISDLPQSETPCYLAADVSVWPIFKNSYGEGPKKLAFWDARDYADPLINRRAGIEEWRRT